MTVPPAVTPPWQGEIVLGFDDLQATPDDGRRSEILDGAFVVHPAPGTPHQWVVRELLLRLQAAATPSGLQVFTVPLAWIIGPGQIPEPDLIVASTDALTMRGVEGPPAIVVEVLSPWGRNRDRLEKRRIYAEGGAGEYWIVDPDVPSMTVLRLSGMAYDEVTTVSGAEVYETDRPFAVRVAPADLVWRPTT